MSYLPTSPKIAAAVARPACPPAIPPMPLQQERAMKRLHVHVSVDDLAQSTRFYSTLFAAEPTVIKDDYVKWMLEDPRVNFAISTRPGRAAGISHLGIQAEDEVELAEVYDRLARREADRRSQGDDLLLRPIRQAMDRRPAGGALGNLPHLGRKHGLWRRLASQAERGQRNRLLHTGLLRTRSDPASAASAGSRKRLLHTLALLIKS